ncbi:YbaB/EbfC family nucleoid-associated protein [Nocardia vinacea]|uniref:YbaB/EbfC family nucleoid-associated protein n=1 Tax=Nocardia vinacea TaxID=96468 RepID=A0ABZ1YXH5_9NOCA|nr:YbaB/EbfC family nucleoid-associated protein [Nocardia vinacea]
MRDERVRAGLQGMMETLRDQLGELQEFERRRMALTATAESLDGRVTVTVDAEGHVIDTEFADDIHRFAPEKLAAAVTAAAKAAAADVALRCEELRAPLLEGYEKIPKLSDMVDLIPQLDAELPTPPRSLALRDMENDPDAPVTITNGRPGSAVFADPEEELSPLHLSDVDDHDQAVRPRRESEVSDAGWE